MTVDEKNKIEARIAELEEKRRCALAVPGNPLYFHVPYDPVILYNNVQEYNEELTSLRAQLEKE